MTRRLTGLTLIGVGVLISFAVTLPTSVIDPRATGYVIIMAGVLSLALPRRHPSSRTRRSLLIRHYQQNARPVRPPSTER